MGNPSQANQYLTTRVLTARPEELRMMLLDGAVKFAKQGREGLVNKNYEVCFNGFSRCRDILFELLSTMRPQGDPDMVQRLGTLYGYMISRLLQASTERDLAKADEVIGLVEYERETWQMVMDKIAEEQRGAKQPQPGPAMATAGVGDTAEPSLSTLSLEG